MVGGGGEGADEDVIDGVVTCNNVQGGVSDGATLQEKYLGSDGGDVEDAGGVTP